uniref:Cytochrome c biogenesis protein CcsA n=1 Tax=Aldrovanda vesiculosa TaxID=173386 RepID=A0A1Z2RR58_9CARY|nr:cytochrome c biogenesis protein [Aldrovanda vesiculosa]ASA46313.1 cytochrome c biogenesis protein [Aldrovanda vesiculosa]QBC71197.1 cytochrome c heme attachment protein [Aldrovanda vesiculosa]
MLFSTLEHILTHISFSIVLITITIFLVTFLIKKRIELYDSLEKGMLITFFCLTGLLVTRWIFSKHFPLSDLYESLIFLSWGFYIIHIIPLFKPYSKFLSTIIRPSVIFLQGFATSGLLQQRTLSILVPALQSQWLMMHVSMMVLGYAALLCGSLLSVAFLAIQTERSFFFQRKYFLNELFLFGETQYMNEKKSTFLTKTLKNYYRYQFNQQLDHWSYRLISLGFIFLTLGILSGAVWANEAWGSYWNWDPKETWAFITWTIFAIYLHIRTNKNWQSENSAIVSSLGFLIIWICYFGVNLLGIGLHSYGSFGLALN